MGAEMVEGEFWVSFRLLVPQLNMNPALASVINKTFMTAFTLKQSITKKV
jgi:hypothetical protein